MGNDNGNKHVENEQDVTSPTSPSILNFATAVLLWLIISCGTCFALIGHNTTTTNKNPITGNLLVTSLIFFNNLNIFIAICEICLSLEIMFIKSHYNDLCKKYKGGGKEWAACQKFIMAPLTVSQLFQTKTWAKMWSTYALFDPSYQNHESFGFFIDVGNGYSTILPCLLLNFAMVFPDSSSTTADIVSNFYLWVGCITLASQWQMMYGTFVYALSFLFNRRYEGHNVLSVGVFVICSNIVWVLFPALAMYAAVIVLRDGNFDVFRL